MNKYKCVSEFLVRGHGARVFSRNDNLLAVLVSQMIVLDLFDRFESVVVEENLDQSIGRETTDF